MKLKSFLKNHFFKFLSLFSIFVIIFSFFTLNISAASSWAALPITFTRVTSNTGLPPDVSTTQFGVNSIRFTVQYDSNLSQLINLFTFDDSVLTDGTIYDVRFTATFLNMDPSVAFIRIGQTRYPLELNDGGGYEVIAEDFKYTSTNSQFAFSFSFDASIKGVYTLTAYYRVSESNTLANGWDKPPAPSSGELGNFEDTESTLLEDTQPQFEQSSNSVTDTFLGSLQRYASSFSAVSRLFQELLYLGSFDLNILVNFSLFLGILPLIVGASINGLRARDRSSARARQESAYKRGYNSGYTRGKGG